MSNIFNSIKTIDIYHIILIVIIIGLVIYILNSVIYPTEGYDVMKIKYSKSCPCGVGCKCGDKQLAVSKIMVKLWVQHLIYTRLTVMALLDANKDTDVLTARLLRNPKDFGDAISELYDKTIGNAVAKLLMEHLEIALRVVYTIRIDSSYDKNVAIKELYANADNLGTYLDALTHNHDDIFRHHMKMHIDTLLANVTAYASNNYDTDIKTMDAYLNAGIDMAFDMAVTL
jgi:hypothetical protein